MKPAFSIITATKNSGLLFALTANSLFSLHWTDFEWIIVDSSSDHESIQVVDYFAKGRATLLRGKDRGIAHAFNLGIEASSGLSILILNAGDTYAPDFLDVCAANSSDKVIYCGSTTLLDKNMSSRSLFTPRPSALWRGMHIAHCWMCVPRKIYDEVGLYREIAHAMDYEWCKRALAKYGTSVFRCSSSNKSYGTYLLGGHSDKNYFAGLHVSKQLNIEYGMNSFLAQLIYIGYAVKHFLSQAASRR
jgi:glycosyltransferase involved in cell wall biosynthesis